MSIGVFETPSFPTNNRIVTSWFPKQERARAIAIYTSGQYMGLAILTPSLIAIQSWVGWRGLFIASGVIGLIWAGVWYTFYRDPLDHKGVNEAELNYIKKGGALVNKGREEKKAKWDWRELKYAFQFRKLWGIYIGQFCIGATFIFFLTWFPTYLVKYRGMDFLQSGFLASIPFIAAFFGVLSSGFISDTLVNRGYSTAVARKAPVIIGMFLSTTIIGANYVDSSFLLITFLSIAFFGNGFASITWVFVSAMAPERLIGLIGGVFNFMGGLSAIIVPAAIGFLVTDDNFSPALIFIAILTFIGLLSFIFLVGKIERIAIPESSTT
ncbi:UNVERIFIED_CONTAM: hypothetical protein GTU68_014919 [Idotea baltica]|nr:hypothetical protein [Idotea baltica]